MRPVSFNSTELKHRALLFWMLERKSQTETSAGEWPAFAVNDFYESLLKRKRDDPEGFARSFSDALQLAVDRYEIVRREQNDHEQFRESRIREERG